MESIEQTGRTVDEAVDTALKRLGVQRQDVDVEVLAEESRGLLGILGYSAAKVRVTLRKPVLAEERAEEEQPEPEFEPTQAEVLQEESIIEPSELAERARDIGLEIIDLMGIRAGMVIVRDDDEGVAINIHSEDDVGLLIGKRGQTLSSLQLIVAMMANREMPQEERRRIILDAEGYRARRDRALQTMALSAARRAKRSGRPVTMSSLTPRERRVIHIALAEDPGVSTRSEGEDPNRSVVVVPRRRSGSSGERSESRRRRY